MGSDVRGADLERPQFNGVIPELRGIRLAQLRLNQLADADPRNRENLDGNVYIRVDVREAGEHFRDAPTTAGEVARQSGQKVPSPTTRCSP
ncbi:MAG: hypothetical protein GEV11_27375 [Streptosporangiales bacterium]|nr:hypothetical protein [Streptosporangiales bacterium]